MGMSSIFEWLPVVLSALLGTLALVKAYLDYKKGSGYAAEVSAAVMCFSFTMLALVVAQSSKDQQARATEIKQHIDAKLSVGVEITENPTESEILRAITTRLEEDKHDPKLRLLRTFSVPEALPGLSPDDDTLVANTFKAYGFRLTYLVAFRWNSSAGSSEEQQRQRQMGSFLIQLLTSSVWSDLSAPHLAKKELFHVPITQVHDSWAIVTKKRSRAGLAFAKEGWGGAFDPGFESAIFIDQPSLAKGIVRDVDEVRKFSVAHLRSELAKPGDERCLCALFAGPNPEAGLEPLSVANVKQRASSSGSSKLVDIVQFALPE